MNHLKKKKKQRPSEDAIFHAIHSNDTSAFIRRLRSENFDVNCRRQADDAKKMTPLLYAMHLTTTAARRQMIWLLLARVDVDINAVSEDGWTALTLACARPRARRWLLYAFHILEFHIPNQHNLFFLVEFAK